MSRLPICVIPGAVIAWLWIAVALAQQPATKQAKSETVSQLAPTVRFEGKVGPDLLARRSGRPAVRRIGGEGGCDER